MLNVGGEIPFVGGRQLAGKCKFLSEASAP